MSPRVALAKVAGSGSRLETLRALRDRLAREIDGCRSARDVAALSRQFTDVLVQIDDAPAAVKGTPLDELAKRRGGAGGSTSSGKARSAGSKS